MPGEPSREEMARELAEVLAVSAAGDDRFMGSAPDWFGGRVFGGVVVGQVLAAAVQTVDGGRRPHSLHGYFVRPVVPGPAVQLAVDRVRNGRTFSLRKVTLAQGDRPAAEMMVSFCADEPGPHYQPSMPDVPGPEAVAPNEEFEGPVDLRDLGPTEPGPDGTFTSTRRSWIKLPEVIGEDPLTHAAVLAYLSDLTGNGFRPLSLDQWEGWSDASLDHSVWFHRPTRADRWLFFDLHSAVNVGGRSLVRGAMYDQEGHLVLSMAQELLIRASPPPG